MDGQKAIGIRITEKPVTASCTMTFQMHQVEAWTADPRAACRPHLPCMATPSFSGSISIAGVGKKSDFSSNSSFDRGRPPAPTHGGRLRRPSLAFSNLLVAGWSVRGSHPLPPRISETGRKHSEHCRDESRGILSSIPIPRRAIQTIRRWGKRPDDSSSRNRTSGSEFSIGGGPPNAQRPGRERPVLRQRNQPLGHKVSQHGL